MKTQNSVNTVNTVNSKKQSNSNYSKFLEGYKNAKIEDSKDLAAHLVVVKNFINAHNRDFAPIAPVKNWLSILNREGFAPRTSKKGNYSLFYTLQAILKALNTK